MTGSAKGSGAKRFAFHSRSARSHRQAWSGWGFLDKLIHRSCTTGRSSQLNSCVVPARSANPGCPARHVMLARPPSFLPGREPQDAACPGTCSLPDIPPLVDAEAAWRLVPSRTAIQAGSTGHTCTHHLHFSSNARLLTAASLVKSSGTRLTDMKRSHS
jgi:hypothetical protein